MSTSKAAIDRSTMDPGLPVSDPTASYWQKDPHPELANIQSPVLPENADVIIIGSGITGCSVTYHLLEQRPWTKVVMVEARTITSGATGRNGGHVKDASYHVYKDLKDRFGTRAAEKIVRFKESHLDAMIRLVEKLEGDVLAQSEFRQVRGVHAVVNSSIWEEEKARLALFLANFPDQRTHWELHEGEKALESLRLPNIAGAITGPAAALSPYRLITSILERLRRNDPNNFSIETHTPVLKVSAQDGIYHVETSRGTITAPTVAHCTNGYLGHLIPSLRGPIVPVRGQMTVQSPGQSFSNEGSRQSWSFIHQRGFDYMTQSGANGDIFLGGGLMNGDNKGLDEYGNSDDGRESLLSIAHLNGLLPVMFGTENWGIDASHEVRTKGTWTGIMGWSADGLPWVGRIHNDPTLAPSKSCPKDGEWVAGGFSGEGMVYAWRAGEALVAMILGLDISDWFPEQFLVSEARLRQANPHHLLQLWQ